MITVGEKKWKDLTDEEKISHCKDNLVGPARDERRTHDRKWYLSTQFLAGNHYVYYNLTSNAIESPPRRRNAVRLVINKIKATVRSVLNYSTRFQPKFECIPGDLDKDTIKNARRAGKVLDYLFVKLYLRSKVRKLVRHSLTTSVGFWELGWDDEAEDGLGQLTVVNHDPFDIFLPATAYFEGPKIHSPFLAKVVSRNVADIKADERYDEKVRKDVKPDDEIAYSTMKARILRKHGQKSDRSEGQKTALVYEVMLWDPEGNEKGGNVNLITFVNEDKLLIEEELENTEFPVYVMQADTSSSRIYDTSWVEDMIPINKALDRQESQHVEYVNQMLRARILTEKGHGANLAATGRSGMDVEVIEVNPGKKFEQFRVFPLPQTGEAQIGRFNRYLEDVGGAHEACVSDDTEILTENGWSTRKELEIGTRVLTLSPDTKLSEWQPIKDIHTYERDNEDLLLFENNNVSALVTSNHRWFVRGNSARIGNKWEYVSYFKETKDLEARDNIPLSAAYGDFPKISKVSDDYVELVGWVVTDGTFSLSKQQKLRRQRRVRIIQKKQPQVDKIRALLHRLGVAEGGANGWEQKDGCYHFQFAGEFAGRLRKDFPDKIPTNRFILSLPEKQLRILYETMLLGDGSNDGTHASFYNTDKEMIDAFQLVCTLLGKATRILVDDREERSRPLFEVSVKGSTEFTHPCHLGKETNFISKKRYSGKVWCPETENGTWLMRRNGKVVFTGNSMGSIPTGARSGKTLEALQAADANNLAGIREGLEDFLSVVGSRMLDIVAEKYQTSRVVKLAEEEEGQKYMKVIGGEAEQRPEGAAIINKDNEIIVKIGSWLGYTREAQRKTLMDLGDRGYLPKEKVLTDFEFANVEELSAKAREERLEEVELQADIAGRRGEGQPGGGQQPAGPKPGGGPDMLALADEENARMMNGEVLKPTPNAPPDHSQAHVDFLESPDAEGRGAMIIEEHVRGELGA